MEHNEFELTEAEMDQVSGGNGALVEKFQLGDTRVHEVFTPSGNGNFSEHRHP
jgi:hypothetical protein